MSKFYFSILAMLITFTAFAQTHLYQHEDFDQITADHKTIAILPFDATIKLRPKQMKELSQDQLTSMEQKEGENIQEAMYSWFLKRKKRGSLQVDVQPPRTTNSILLKNNLDIYDLSSQSPTDIAAMLGVDAVVMGNLETNKPMSEGAAVVTTLLIGFGNTNNAIVNMEIYNATDGVLLWNYNKKVRGGLGSGPDDLINTLMRKASRRLGYTD
ncbi:hypothetical protein [Nonlabens agnitus]|uniref:Secreted protein n=1 Tax=Nonlabens agnitus TaxID=870484 RepID=A0A2S9WVT8_9FLAO|nr:hypothetical protein [Nonlabens agnitus]PRP67561.1 hypothetical protein BST86_10895 [Nonlabens agnitus]